MDNFFFLNVKLNLSVLQTITNKNLKYAVTLNDTFLRSLRKYIVEIRPEGFLFPYSPF